MSPRLCISQLAVTRVSFAGALAATLYARPGGTPGVAAFVSRAIDLATAAPPNSASR